MNPTMIAKRSRCRAQETHRVIIFPTGQAGRPPPDQPLDQHRQGGQHNHSKNHQPPSRDILHDPPRHSPLIPRHSSMGPSSVWGIGRQGCCTLSRPNHAKIGGPGLLCQTTARTAGPVRPNRSRHGQFDRSLPPTARSTRWHSQARLAHASPAPTYSSNPAGPRSGAAARGSPACRTELAAFAPAPGALTASQRRQPSRRNRCIPRLALLPPLPPPLPPPFPPSLPPLPSLLARTAAVAYTPVWAISRPEFTAAVKA